MTIYFENQIDYTFEFDYKKIADDVINKTLLHEHFMYDVEVSITLVNEDDIKEINSDYRNINKVTDVLSFPMIEYDSSLSKVSNRTEDMYDFIKDKVDVFNRDTREVILGDIVLCVPVIIRQASEYNHSILREYAFLIVHSMLHLLGFDHIEDDERAVMENEQKLILESLDITRDL